MPASIGVRPNASSIMVAKSCTRCGRLVGADGYARNARSMDGLAVKCRDCDAERNRRYREANADRARKRSRHWRAANADRHREYNRRWREANADRERERARRYREANADRRRESQRRWYEAANPERHRQRDRARRALKRDAPSELYTRDQVLAASDYHCWLCGNEIEPGLDANHPGGLHIDHVISLSNGGADVLDNVRAAHAVCNRAKNSRDDWRPDLAWLVVDPGHCVSTIESTRKELILDSFE